MILFIIRLKKWKVIKMTNILLGGAIADALGVPFETKPEEDYLVIE